MEATSRLCVIVQSFEGGLGAAVEEREEVSVGEVSATGAVAYNRNCEREELCHPPP